jgi:hypothetical protein
VAQGVWGDGKKDPTAAVLGPRPDFQQGALAAARGRESGGGQRGFRPSHPEEDDTGDVGASLQLCYEQLSLLLIYFIPN